jgi:FkbM family methyltransferase
MKTSIFKSNNICLVILFILIIIVIIQSDRYEIISKILANKLPESTSPPRNVFFDLGANVGDSAENFLGLLDKVENVNDIKDVIPENKLKEKWIMYLIEGNSRFDDNLLKIKQKHSDKHEIIVLNGTIVSDHDGEITFFLDQKNKNQVGSSIFENHRDVIANKLVKQTKPCVDLARLLRQYRQSDNVVVKMDIEGAEFELLVHLIKENVLGLIDTLAIEYHKYMSPYKSEYALFSKIFKKYNIDEKNWL